MAQTLGVVVIGRNEGERLRRCLTSVAEAGPCVYVDSGSTDGSVDLAVSLGATVVDLDLTRKFTAARGRNEGYRALREAHPEVTWVQFVDGDCELAPSWIPRVRNEIEAAELDPDARAAVFCGRRREIAPDDSVYNRLCDVEWDTPIGEAEACGGDAVMLCEALDEVGGFTEELIAGEEPELCLRLRSAGWTVHRIDEEMTRHDAAMTRFSQWWQRAVRAGHAFAEVSWLSRRSRLRLWARETRSIVAYGVALPCLTVALVLVHPLCLLGPLALYARLVVRIAKERARRGDDTQTAWAYARFTVLGKFAQAIGWMRYHRNRVLGRRSLLIEYK